MINYQRDCVNIKRLIQRLMLTMKLNIIILSFLCSLIYITVSMKIPNKGKGRSQPYVSTRKLFIDAIIYENKDRTVGQSVSYKQSSTAFYDLRSVVDSFDEKQINWVCVLGSWLLYTQPEFGASSLSEVKLLSSEEKCILPGMFLGSVQPIGPLSPLFTDSVTFFKKEFFASEGVSVKGSTSADKLKLLVSAVESFIVTGHSKWTLVVDFSQTICVSVKTNKPGPICFVPYLENKSINKLFEVRKGCSSEVKYDGYLTLEECTSFGGGLIENIEVRHTPRIVPSGSGFMKPKGRGVGNYLAANSQMHGRTIAKGRNILKRQTQGDCKSADNDNDAEGERKCTELLDMRINKAVDIMEKDKNFMLPTQDTNVWKTELLDATFIVAGATCPFEIAVPEYLKFIKELFLYHVNAAWERNEEETHPVDEEVWRKVVLQTRVCGEIAVKDSTRFQENVMMLYSMIRTPGDISVPEMPAFQLNREKDTVIEYIWLVANHVASICHHSQEYVDDFLHTYTEVFHFMYLLPVIEQWNNPGNTLMRCYNHILGGYDMDNQYQRMRVCTEHGFRLVHNLEPWNKSWIDKEMWWARK